MEIIVMYFVILILCCLHIYVITYYIPLKKDTLGNQSSFKYILHKYDLSLDKKRARLLSKVIALTNAFILSIPVMLVLFLNIKRIYIFGIAFVVFVIGIVGLYNLIGFILKKKGW